MNSLEEYYVMAGDNFSLDRDHINHTVTISGDNYRYVYSWEELNNKGFINVMNEVVGKIRKRVSK